MPTVFRWMRASSVLLILPLLVLGMLAVEATFTTQAAQAQGRSCGPGYVRTRHGCVRVHTRPAGCGPNQVRRGRHCIPRPSVPQTTASCGANEVRHGRRCDCADGYRRVNGQCVKPPATASCGSYEVRHGRRCDCIPGYTRKDRVCAPVQTACGAYEVRRRNECVCQDGYTRKDGQCVSLQAACGANEIRHGRRCDCAPGYTRKDRVCAPVQTACGAYEVRRRGECVCQDGYTRKDGQCVSLQASCATNEVRRGRSCVCESGYRRRHGTCVRPGGVAVPIVPTSPRPGTSGVALPNPALQDFLRTLKRARRTPPANFDRMTVRSVLPNSIYYGLVQRNGQVKQPLQVTDEALVLLDPSLTPAQAQEKIAQHDLGVIDAVPEIGALHVDTSRLRQRLGGTGPAADLEAGRLAVPAAITELRKEPSFAAVTPNVVLTPHQIASAVRPKGPALQLTSSSTPREKTDWGIYDAKIDRAWGRLRGKRFKVGVLDVGFAQHEDLKMLPALMPVQTSQDHGNHVAGIACALHNGKGIRGTVPNCTAMVSTGSFVLDLSDPIENVNTRFSGTMAEYIATIVEFIVKNPDVKVINVSIGNNWMPNFNIDPSSNSAARDEIRIQGRLALSALTAAKAKNVVIVSSAGNDSAGLSTPAQAKWSSPFNWAALEMKDQEGWSNGLVVEAHDKDGKRADFSNTGGNVSAPGVDVYSAIATGTSSYGTMSGTSMAAPYASGALAVLRAARPRVSLKRAIQCLLASTAKTDAGTPKLDLTHAINECRR